MEPSPAIASRSETGSCLAVTGLASAGDGAAPPPFTQDKQTIHYLAKKDEDQSQSRWIDWAFRSQISSWIFALAMIGGLLEIPIGLFGHYFFRCMVLVLCHLDAAIYACVTGS